jgi:hypothetical protein
MIDIEMKLRSLVGLKENYVIRKAVIGSHGQIVKVFCGNGKRCKQIGVTLNSVSEIVFCKDIPCDIDTLKDDITETCQSGLLLADLVAKARLVNQRYCLAKKINELILVSGVVGEVLSEAQAEALQNLQRVIDKKNLFKEPGERENIFRIVITFNDELSTVEDVRDYKGLRNVHRCLLDDIGENFSHNLLMDSIFLSV